jgi:hypothetical protein
VEKLVTTLMRGGVTPDQIGVITPYEGQRAHTVTTMLRVGACHSFWFKPNSEMCHHPLRGPARPHCDHHAAGGGLFVDSHCGSKGVINLCGGQRAHTVTTMLRVGACCSSLPVYKGTQ